MQHKDMVPLLPLRSACCWSLPSGIPRTSKAQEISRNSWRTAAGWSGALSLDPSIAKTFSGAQPLGDNSLVLPSVKGLPSRDTPPHTSQSSRERKERTREGQACRDQASSCPKSLPLTAKPWSLDPPLSAHIMAASGSSAGKLHRKSTPSLGRCWRTPPPPEHQPFPRCPQRGTSQQDRAHPCYPGAARSHTSYSTNCFIKCRLIKPVS